MERAGLQEARLQIVDSKGSQIGKRKLKPRHLSRIIRDEIVRQFAASMSTEDVATVLSRQTGLKIPVRTIQDVVLAELIRKPPITAQSVLFINRKIA